mmetsp:Transcript_12546/g.19948  ORF Transcript_12546/g.19948 Transcript_12546/m.19948 type:complete len:345 (+) Transcript_12546:3003-4037(+)
MPVAPTPTSPRLPPATLTVELLCIACAEKRRVLEILDSMLFFRRLITSLRFREASSIMRRRSFIMALRRTAAAWARSLLNRARSAMLLRFSCQRRSPSVRRVWSSFFLSNSMPSLVRDRMNLTSSTFWFWLFALSFFMSIIIFRSWSAFSSLVVWASLAAKRLVRSLSLHMLMFWPLSAAFLIFCCMIICFFFLRSAASCNLRSRASRVVSALRRLSGEVNLACRYLTFLGRNETGLLSLDRGSDCTMLEGTPDPNVPATATEPLLLGAPRNCVALGSMPDHNSSLCASLRPSPRPSAGTSRCLSPRMGLNLRVARLSTRLSSCWSSSSPSSSPPPGTLPSAGS